MSAITRSSLPSDLLSIMNINVMYDHSRPGVVSAHVLAGGRQRNMCIRHRRRKRMLWRHDVGIALESNLKTVLY